MRKILLLPFFAATVSACSDPAPVSYSSPVGINLKARGDDVKGTAVTGEKNINTEVGNPYGAFVTAARQKLAGKDPSRIELGAASLLLGGMSKGVTALEQVLSGTTEILFVMNDTNNSFKAAHAGDPKGTGPIKMTVDFDPSLVKGDDWMKLLGGNFKVSLRSPAAAGFAGQKGSEADLQVTLTFEAFE